MQYTDNNIFLMPWGKYQGLTVAEMVKKDRKYAEFIIKPDAVKSRIIQELSTPTPTAGDNIPEHQEDGLWDDDLNGMPF